MATWTHVYGLLGAGFTLGSDSVRLETPKVARGNCHATCKDKQPLISCRPPKTKESNLNEAACKKKVVFKDPFRFHGCSWNEQHETRAMSFEQVSLMRVSALASPASIELAKDGRHGPWSSHWSKANRPILTFWFSNLGFAFLVMASKV